MKKRTRNWLISIVLPAIAISSQPMTAADGGFESFSSILEAGARDVELSGNIAYVLYFSGLLILDYSDPSNPVLVGKYLFEESPLDLRLMGELCVVADSTAGILVIDVSDPSRPTLIGSYDTNLEAMGLDLQGDTLFVANGLKGFMVLSLDDPEAPAFITELNNFAPHWAVDAEGDYAFLASLQNGLDIFRVSDLPNLDRLYRLTELPCLNLAIDVEVTATHAYLANGHYLAAVDVSGLPDNPPVLESCTYTRGRALDIFIEYPYLYLASDVAGFHVYDIGTNPGQPDSISGYDTPDDARGIAVEAGIAVVADDFGVPVESAGVLFMDVSDPGNPQLLGTYPSGGECHGGVVEGDLAFVAQGSNGLAVVNIQDPYNPAIIGSFTDSIGFVHSVDIGDTLLAVANGSRGLMILGVSNPSLPSYLGEVEVGLPGQRVTRVKISGGMAYVVNDDLYAVDISNPVSPAVVSSYVSPLDFEDLALAGDLAFVANGEGILALDISQPADTLRLAGELDTPGITTGVDARGGLLYVAEQEGVVRVIRYQVGGEMEELGHVDLGDRTCDVAARDNVAFIGLEDGGVVSVDVVDPDSPVEMDRFPTPGWRTESVEVGPSVILACDITSAIFLGYSPTGIRGDNGTGSPPLPVASAFLSQNRPNPFNPSTSIVFQVPVSGTNPGGDIEVSLDIFSLRGRRVKELYRDRARAGEHVVFWDGSNADGESVPSGVYIYILKMGEIRVARKMLLVR